MANRKLQELFGISACPDVNTASRFPIQKVFQSSYEAFCENGANLSEVQKKAAHALIRCKSGSLGCNVSVCEDCGHTEIHNNSCRNRHCPNCQAVLKEVWVDKRRSEVIDSPYFHVVFTLPMNSTLSFTVTRSSSTPFSTNAAHRPFWNFVKIKNISARHPGSYRSYTPGTRSFPTMSICTASSPAAD